MASHQGPRRPGPARNGPLPKRQAPRHQSDGDRQRTDQSPTPSARTTPSPRPRAGVPLPGATKNSGTPAQGRGDDRNGIPSGAQKAGPSAQWPAPQAAYAPPPGRRRSATHRLKPDAIHTNHPVTPASSRGPASWCTEDQRDPGSGPG